MTVTLGVKSVSISERHLGNSNQAIDSLPQGASVCLLVQKILLSLTF